MNAYIYTGWFKIKDEITDLDELQIILRLASNLNQVIENGADFHVTFAIGLQCN